MLYVLSVKLVPSNIYELLTARGLAFWLMGDVSRHEDGMDVGVYAFTLGDIDKLMLVLQYKFNNLCYYSL